MKTTKMIVLLMIQLSWVSANAAEIDLKITSLSNVRGNGAMEACGTALHSQGIKPLVVTVKHDESIYSTLTSGEGKWCVLIKRWTFSGEVEAYATTLDGTRKSDVRMKSKSLK